MTKITMDFSDIEPYRDKDVRRVLTALVEDDSFVEVMEYVFPEKSMEEIKSIFSQLDTVYDFQREIAYVAMNRIIEATVAGIELKGLENIQTDKKYLYISNHRDIILDSALFNVMLFEKAIETTETAIGNNLLGHPTVNALTKLNKNFIVSRDLKGRELYSASLKLSTYIRNSIVQGHSSIWISQREGRAKNGDDKTQKGLLKMLAMSGKGNVISNLEELRIRTLSISYEYDPCDVFKIKELIARDNGEDYIKADDEDKMSIIAGITGPKGRMSYAIGRVQLGKDVQGFEGMSGSDQLQYLADTIDRSIYENYTLYPINYYAYDQLFKTNKYGDHYSHEEVVECNRYFSEVMSQLDHSDNAYRILLKKYAFPVINKEG